MAEMIPQPAREPSVKTLDLPRRGLTVAYDDAGAGMAVVLLHAFPFDHDMWEPQRDALAAAGYRVLTPDFPGFGGTTTGEESFGIDGGADVVADFLEGLGVMKAVVGGLSMGGYAAMAFARRHPGKLAGLILADTKAAPDDEAARANRDKLIDKVRGEGVAALVDVQMPKLVSEHTRTSNPTVVRRVETIAKRQAPAGVISGLAALRDRPDAAPELGNVKVPTLILVGEYDEVTPPLAAARMGSLIPGSEVKHIPAAGHMSNLENPEAFNAAVVAFLKRLNKG
jgi:pimeloyl-ACP methyl ester carboxylesterase